MQKKISTPEIHKLFCLCHLEQWLVAYLVCTPVELLNWTQQKSSSEPSFPPSLLRRLWRKNAMKCVCCSPLYTQQGVSRIWLFCTRARTSHFHSAERQPPAPYINVQRRCVSACCIFQRTPSCDKRLRRMKNGSAHSGRVCRRYHLF